MKNQHPTSRAKATSAEVFETFHHAKRGKRAKVASLGIVVLLLVTLGVAVPAVSNTQQGNTPPPLLEVLSAGKRSKELKNLVENTQARLLFSKDMGTRVAIGNEEIAKVEALVSNREIVLIGRKIGTTSLMVWFQDGTVEQFMFSVTRDLTVLQSALSEISPTIIVEIAPDRDAIVLTGTVSHKEDYEAAQKAAQDYLSAGANAKDNSKEAAPPALGAQTPLTAQGQVINRLKITSASLPLEQVIARASEVLGAKEVKVERILHGDRPNDQYDQFVVRGTVRDRGMRDEILSKAGQIVKRFDPSPRNSRTIEESSGSDKRRITEYEEAPNRIHDRLYVLPAPVEPKTPEEKPRQPLIVERLLASLGNIGCDTSRIQAQVLEGLGGDGVLMLTGSVPDQTCLLRVLTIASRLAGGAEGGAKGLDIQVVADESGALSMMGGRSDNMSSGLGSVLSSVTSGSGTSGTGLGRMLDNRIDSNIARAKALQLAGGKVLSFLRVEDIPQVRIDIKLYEVNRTALLAWNSNTSATVSDFNRPSQLAPPAFQTNPVTGELEPIPNGPTGNADFQNTLAFLAGGIANNFRVSGDHVDINSLLSLLEKEGIARTLSSPSLTVLSGESAFFGVGGSVPVQQQIVTPFGSGQGQGQNSGLLNATVERDFGIRLAVRPLIDELGMITLDVIPSVSNPDADLTELVRQSTGTNPQTVAFQERSLRTSARLRDGQTLLIGGLVEKARNDDAGQTPFIHQVPIVGWFFKDFSYADSDRELIIVVNPVIVRDLPDAAPLWSFPSSKELIPAKTAKDKTKKETQAEPGEVKK